jgi:RNA polymerase sigma-70 factor (ECF subfamily)
VPADDEALMQRVAAGDEPALAELLRRYQRPLSAFLGRSTGGLDVEDLFQETWLRVVRAADRFDPQRKFSTWLFQIAVNLCRDRARRHRPTIGLDGVEPVAADTNASVQQRIDARALLARLPEPQREVVILRYYHDLSEAEVAEVLGCPRGTVKSRLHSALARLADSVDDEQGENG